MFWRVKRRAPNEEKQKTNVMRRIEYCTGRVMEEMLNRHESTLNEEKETKLVERNVK